ncbi:MaoC family dehydratase [Actinophytocola sp. NPDC049390]|uniref:MaoC family dehydratase n=1 Tax=Actinophytocola sp. NPDC049390 TaxID=3363894 RepID=UPI00379CEFC6
MAERQKEEDHLAGRERHRRDRRTEGELVVNPIIARGRYLEELRVGDLYQHRPGRTVGEADNTLFSTLTMNPQSLHLDAKFSEGTEFGQRLVNSLFTLSTLVGLSVSDLTQATTVANLGFGEIGFPKPVFHGDTLYAETEVISVRESRSRPDAGVVVFEHRARNQHGEVVAVARRSALMMRAPQEDA